MSAAHGAQADDPWWNYVPIHTGLPDGFKLILEHGVDPDVLGSGGFTILHHLATDYARMQHRLTRAMMLLDGGASLDQRDPLLKSTPLGWACRWGRVDLVKLYLERRADAVEAAVNRGQSLWPGAWRDYRVAPRA